MAPPPPSTQTVPMLPPPPSTLAEELWARLRLRGGAGALSQGATLTSRERNIRVRENRRRRDAGQPLLPRGLWPPDFPRPAGGQAGGQADM